MIQITEDQVMLETFGTLKVVPLDFGDHVELSARLALDDDYEGRHFEVELFIDDVTNDLNGKKVRLFLIEE